MSNIHFDTVQLRQQIDALLIQYPELREDEVLRMDMLEAETDLNAVLEKLLAMASAAGTIADAIKLRSDALSARKARFERREEAMRSLIQTLMERAELKSLTLPEATLSLSFRKPSPIVIDEAALPDEFCKFKRTADMAKIKEAGALPPGCSMSNGRNVLTVRVK